VKSNRQRMLSAQFVRSLFFSTVIGLSLFTVVAAQAQDDEYNDEAATEQTAETESEGATQRREPAKAPRNTAPEQSTANTEAKEPTAAANPSRDAVDTSKPPAMIKPWALTTDPIFKGPTVKRYQTPADLTGRDRQLLETLDYKPTATKMRLEQIRKLAADLKKLSPKSEAAINANLTMLRYYEEQALVFEWMRVVGVTDPSYPDLAGTLKNIRRQQAQRYYDMLLNNPKNPNAKQWKYKQLIARMRLGDPSVRDEAIAAVKAGNPDDVRELAAVGTAIDAGAGRLPSPFGSLESIAQNSTDQYESAAFKLLIAEQQMITNKHSQAVAILQEVIATCRGIRRGDKERTPGAILQAASHMLIASGLKSSATINPEITQTLVNNDLLEYARSYLEQFALANYSKNLQASLKAYGDALAVGTISEDVKTKAELRMLDLNIASNDLRMMQFAWERAISRGVQKQTPLDSQLVHTVNLVGTRFKMTPEKNTADQFVALHDLFVRGFGYYAAREDYALRVIDALYQTKQYNEVIRRSEPLLPRFRDRQNRITAHVLNLKSRSQMMGLGTDIKIGSGAKLIGDAAVPAGYISNADKLRPLLPPHEAEQYLFFTAFVQLLSGQQKPAMVRYEEAFTKHPRGTFSPDSAAFLLDTLTQRKELVDVEKFARMFIRMSIIPSRDPYKDLPRLLERTVFEIAKQQYEAKQYEASAGRYMAFQKEFPVSTQAPIALERAGASYFQANKPELALSAFELFLKQYPKLASAKEIRWTTAEMSSSNKLYLKAAEHYQIYNTLYPLEGTQRIAALKAAENYRLANRTNESLSEYEKYLKTLKNPADQVKILRTIAEIAQKANNQNVALSALERLSKLVKSPDEVISVHFNLLAVYQKMGREDMAKKTVTVILNSKPTTPESFKLQSKAKFTAAKSDINSLRTRNVMNQKDLKAALQALFKDYERVKADLLAPCEIPGVDWCALGYYETSKLASDLSKMLALVEPSKYLDEATVSEIKSLIAWNKDKLKSEARSYAGQAEEALTSSGMPDQETAEKIKLYAQQVKLTRTEEEAAPSSGGAQNDSGF
jgi:tetratricopeptide (TPR) repeat protein